MVKAERLSRPVLTALFVLAVFLIAVFALSADANADGLDVDVAADTDTVSTLSSYFSGIGLRNTEYPDANFINFLLCLHGYENLPADATVTVTAYLPVTNTVFWRSTFTKDYLALKDDIQLVTHGSLIRLPGACTLKIEVNGANIKGWDLIYGNTVEECLNICKSQIERDLSKLLKTKVVLNFFGSDYSPVFEPFEDFRNLVDFVDEDTYQTDTFKETPSLLKLDTPTNSCTSYFLRFDALRSRCRITSQPDWGDILISYTSKKHIDEESLMKYLTSFRGENHFHEEITECCYKRLYDLLDIEHDKDAALFVSALYTRRGGIDINPVRASNNTILELAGNLDDIDVFTRSTLKQ